MAVVIDRTVWLVLTLVFLCLCASPSTAECVENGPSFPQSNPSKCEVVIEPPSSISTYYAAHQALFIDVTADCLTASVNENDFVKLEPVPVVSNNLVSGYRSTNIVFDNITANVTVIFSIFTDPLTILTNCETDIVISDINFGYTIGCTDVEFSWTLLPEFTYSVKAICGKTTKRYTNLTSSSQSMELLEDQESCDVFLHGTRLDGETQNYSQPVSLFQDPLQYVENMQLDGQWNSEVVKLTYLLTLSSGCPSVKPTVVYINTSFESSGNSSFVKCNVRLLECESGNVSSASISTPSDMEIKVVLHLPVLHFPSVLTAIARACNPAGCTANSTKTIPIEVPNPSRNQTGTTGSQPGTTEDPSPTSITPNHDVQIVGGVLGGFAAVVLILIACLCVYGIYKYCKVKRKTEYAVQEVQTSHGEAVTSTKTNTTTEADIAIQVKLDNGQLEHSLDEQRQELKVPTVASQNQPFPGGGISDAKSNRGNPLAAPTREEKNPFMVSGRYKGSLKPSSSAHLRDVTLTEHELQERIGNPPSENTRQVPNSAQDEPTTASISINKTNQESKVVDPSLPE